MKSHSEMKVSCRNQITIPHEARKVLGIKPGDKVLFITSASHALLIAKPKSFAKAIRGLAGSSYPKDYLKAERESWR